VKNRRTFEITEEKVRAMLRIVAKNPLDLFLSEPCRRFFGAARWEEGGKHLEVFQDEGKGVMPGTVAHNRRELEEHGFGSSRRTQRLLNPLSGLSPVYENPSALKVLSIGPRTEMEIFHLLGIGFSLKNIAAVDLISSSPLIDLGDMHALPYPDRAFDVVISSWVLNYSNRPQLAMDEMVRVCADRGLIAIGLTYDPTYKGSYVDENPAPDAIVGSMQRSVEDLTRMLGKKLDRICFQQDPIADQVKGPVMMIARIKH
jgi:hypothetical protein